MAASSADHPYARTLFPFTGEAGELSFDADEIIVLIRWVGDDWLQARRGMEEGLVPASFLQIIVQPEERVGCTDSNDEGGLGMARVVHTFAAEAAGEMSVEEGSELRVVALVNDEWARCFDPSSGLVGNVPISFIELFLDDDVEASFSPTSTSAPSFPMYSSPPVTYDTPPSTSELSTITDPLSHSSNAINPLWTPSSASTWTADWDLSEVASPRHAPPSRPPLPSSAALAEMRRREVSLSYGEPPTTPPGQGEVAQRVHLLVKEMADSEVVFYKDMNAFSLAVGSSSMAEKWKKHLQNMVKEVIELSKGLCLQFNAERRKPMGEMKIGDALVTRRGEFARAYSFFFRSLETAHSIVDGKDAESDVRWILTEMKRTFPDTTCLEITSTITRPIQRCLKYPLFLSQLIKMMPITHSDHPKLLEAMNQMGNLGSKMNESRRRKELVEKYSRDRKNSIGDILSSISVHSVTKKTGRFKIRMGRMFGVYEVPRDNELEIWLSNMEEVERKSVRFNYFTSLHSKRVAERVAELALLKKTNRSQWNLHQIRAQSLINDWRSKINLSVRYQVERILREIPKKIIQKRDDKMLDYVSKSRNKATPRDTLEDARRQYEALNSKLKTQLPKMTASLQQAIPKAWDTLFDIQYQMEEAVQEILREMNKSATDRECALCRDSLKKVYLVVTDPKKGGMPFWKGVRKGPLQTRTTTTDSQRDQAPVHRLQRKGPMYGLPETKYGSTATLSLLMSSHLRASKKFGVFVVRDDRPIEGQNLSRGDLKCSEGDIVFIAEDNSEYPLKWNCWNGNDYGKVAGYALYKIDKNLRKKVRRGSQGATRKGRRRMGSPVDTVALPAVPRALSVKSEQPPQKEENLISLLDEDLPADGCSFGVLTPQPLTVARAPSLPSLASFDPFASTSRPAPTPIAYSHPPLPSTLSSVPLSSIPCLQPTPISLVSKGPLRVTPSAPPSALAPPPTENSTEKLVLSPLNPFRNDLL